MGYVQVGMFLIRYWKEILIGITILLIVLFFILFGYESATHPMLLTAAGIPEHLHDPILTASETYDVPWEYLAAVIYQETRFGTFENPVTGQLMISEVGALGYAQFLCQTWAGWGHPDPHREKENGIPSCTSDIDDIQQYNGYGVDGNGDGKADIWNEYDNIHAMARYLNDLNVVEDTRNALQAYSGGHGATYYDGVMVMVHHFQQYGITMTASGTEWNLENDHVTVNEYGFVVPLHGQITSPFGLRWHPIYSGYRMHNGTDIGCDVGDPILAAQNGTVTRSSWSNPNDHSSGYGKVIDISHSPDMSTRYAHLDQILVNDEDVVLAGQVIGLCGTTGASTGPHLHFEIIIDGKRRNPANYVYTNES